VNRPNEPHWREMAAAASQFFTDHGHHPRANAADPVERGLSKWLQRARAAPRRSGATVSSRAREAFLDTHYPDWRGERDTPWLTMATAASQFFTDHGHHPRARASDPDERTLGEWLRAVRKGAQGLSAGLIMSAERAEFLGEHYPAWRGGDWLWLTRAQEVADFRATRARCPSHVSSNADEARLGRWLATNRWAAATGARTWTPAREDFMDRNVPGWRAPSRAAAWLHHAQEAAAFMAEHGRRPRRQGVNADEDSAARWLSAWRAVSTARGPGWSPDREAFMDQHCPTWRA